jgi:hypothetical protein
MFPTNSNARLTIGDDAEVEAGFVQFCAKIGILLFQFSVSLLCGMDHLLMLFLAAPKIVDGSFQMIDMVFGALTDGTLRLSIIGTLALQLGGR